MNRRRLADTLVPFADLLLAVVIVPAALLMKLARRLGLARMRFTRTMLIRIGVLPLRHHYYEPFTTPSDLRRSLDEERDLPGLEFDLPGQLQFLSKLTYESELLHLGSRCVGSGKFYFGNGSFEAGDAEYLYQMIRALKPARLFEIGSGYSTLIAGEAIARNVEAGGDRCRHVCIEPYEASWLEKTGAEVLRKRVEEVDRALFRQLEVGDLLFIDSSHVIRPQGDVLTEYLQILPTLRPGVIVHVHDVFTPRDYLKEWVIDALQLWNEQYLLEAFLSGSTQWKILGALNLLKHRNFDELKRVCPYLTQAREPGSFYMQRV